MKITKRILDKKSGSEGPSYDPYHYDEYYVTINDHLYCIHLGLMEWFSFDGVQYNHPAFDHFELFKMATGFTPKTFQKYYERLKSKCQKCGHKKFEWHEGFPGESLYICLKCGNVNDYHFDESAIM